MTPEEQQRQDLSDDTAFERLMLSTTLAPDRPPVGVFSTNDIRGRGASFGRGVHESVGANVAVELAARLRPLAFISAYKILDFVVEMTMRLNNEPCPRGRWAFVQKTGFCNRGTPARLSPPLDANPFHWERATKLYVAFDEHRHAVIHRRTQVDANGDLKANDRNGAPLRAITVASQDAFSRLMVPLCDAMISGEATTRQLDAIAWNLDRLQPHHGCTISGAPRPAVVVVRVIDDMRACDADNWNVDGAKLHAHLRQQGVGAIDAIAELHAVSPSGTTVYMAEAREVPDADVEVDVSSLPAWLAALPPTDVEPEL